MIAELPREEGERRDACRRELPAEARLLPVVQRRASRGDTLQDRVAPDPPAIGVELTIDLTVRLLDTRIGARL